MNNNIIYISGFEAGGKITYHYYRIKAGNRVRVNCWDYFKNYKDFKNTLKKYGFKDRLIYIDEFTNDRYSTKDINDYIKYSRGGCIK